MFTFWLIVGNLKLKNLTLFFVAQPIAIGCGVFQSLHCKTSKSLSAPGHLIRIKSQEHPHFQILNPRTALLPDCFAGDLQRRILSSRRRLRLHSRTYFYFSGESLLPSGHSLSMFSKCVFITPSIGAEL
ncbi:hypothetical protein DM860_002331 [Cuscuta australis]|uniref:Uncharacterized protein n=1 Tax=Cuscuta australis TaxID=267555 RepID=A0A328D387_9ASTE|nr:hypothetical protein DM860_002331 [Cuscuta australis]